MAFATSFFSRLILLSLSEISRRLGLDNAVIEIASISIGAIQSLTISNFGAGYTAAPTLNASAVGDGNAQLTARLGALAEYDGYFTGTTGLLSAQGRLQDNYYYQE